jgi:UDP-N-acetylglucosamine--N-acetylmuramyl-(pentapeptide) pyrophosphoryl-undecaprenol N-acetylglucosamine transferase
MFFVSSGCIHHYVIITPMKILFTGGGTGGHFYPIIAIAEAVHKEAKEKKVLSPELFYMAPTKYNPRALFDNDMTFVQVPAGKVRRYFSLLNILDAFTTAYGIIVATLKMFNIYPDVVFGKGGYASFPPLVAARFLRIPVIIHESDSKPGRVNAWAAKFARRIAISYPDAAEYFEKILGPKGVIDKDGKPKIAFTGNPIREELIMPMSTGAHDYLKLDEKVPVIFIIGGSQGSVMINDTVLEALGDLVGKYQIVHQTGKKNFTEVKQTAGVILKENPHASRYHPMEYLDVLAMRMAAGAADVIISRAGSSIFEIASWAKPSIIIPLSEEVSHDQTKNAFSYARSGAAAVIEERNLSAHILSAEIDRIINSPTQQEKMKIAAQNFARRDSAHKIAQVILEIALEHA